MEDDASSIISTAKMNVYTGETSENSNNNTCHYNNSQASKRAKHDHNNKTSSARFKGVVPQQNGHSWGAQIYANHQRIWLGTFKSENEAATAYDSAAVKLRSGDYTHRNFPITNNTVQEYGFQNQYTTETVINMIRDGSYPSKFAYFLRAQSQRDDEIVGTNLQRLVNPENSLFSCCLLFQKELTPSDVGKLNRLVIPKKYAVKYFPTVSNYNDVEDQNGGLGGTGVEDLELVFYDKMLKSWKFRYCYWRSSQSFVFTRGWNRFVKEKKLKSNDIITFYSCDNGDKAADQKNQEFCLIDVVYSSTGENKTCLVNDDVNNHECNEIMQRELEMHLGNFFRYKVDHLEEVKECCEEEKVLNGLEQLEKSVGEKGFRLFGVQIS